MNTNSSAEREAFIMQYMETLLWSSTIETDDGETEPADEHYGPDDLSIVAQQDIYIECLDFMEVNADDLAGIDAEQAGHDFCLTRNHHGAEFWDSGLGDVGDRLTAASHPYGETGVYVGDDGDLHVY